LLTTAGDHDIYIETDLRFAFITTLFTCCCSQLPIRSPRNHSPLRDGHPTFVMNAMQERVLWIFFLDKKWILSLGTFSLIRSSVNWMFNKITRNPIKIRS
jgi:hypothetical protein